MPSSRSPPLHQIPDASTVPFGILFPSLTPFRSLAAETLCPRPSRSPPTLLSLALILLFLAESRSTTSLLKSPSLSPPLPRQQPQLSPLLFWPLLVLSFTVQPPMPSPRPAAASFSKCLCPVFRCPRSQHGFLHLSSLYSGPRLLF